MFDLRYCAGHLAYTYQQVGGTGNWTDFIDFLRFLSVSSEADFQRSTREWLNVDVLMKTLIVKSFLFGANPRKWDRSLTLYHLTPSNRLSVEKGWLFLEDGFDDHLSGSSRSHVVDETIFFQNDEKSLLNALPSRLLSIPPLRRLYVELYIQFISVTFGMKTATADESTPDSLSRFTSLLRFLEPWITTDKLLQVSYGATPAQFHQTAMETLDSLRLRYEVVLAELIKAAQSL